METAAQQAQVLMVLTVLNFSENSAAPTMTFVVVIAAAAVAGMCVTAKKKNA